MNEDNKAKIFLCKSLFLFKGCIYGNMCMSISACMYVGVAHEYLISTELEEDIGPTGTRFKPIVNHHVNPCGCWDLYKINKYS